MGARDAHGDPAKERLLQAEELCGLGQLQCLFHLCQEEHLLRGDRHGPETQHGHDDVVGKQWILLHVLCHTIGELLVECRQRLHLVQGNQGADEEVLVLLLEGQCEPVDDATEDLQQLPNTVVHLTLVDHLEERMLDALPDERAQRHELPIDAVQDRLQVVALTGVLRVKQLQELEYEVLVHITLCNLWVNIIRNNEAQEELIDNLQVRPCALQHRLLVVWFIEGHDRPVLVGQ
mmetsp:Transcript_36944/g.117572  ORF Transcript_36944/g.117572 Transcript_36944/m.117572 type:complete len:234 (-) Transcript_36944:494-1195(-)